MKTADEFSEDIEQKNRYVIRSTYSGNSSRTGQTKGSHNKCKIEYLVDANKIKEIQTNRKQTYLEFFDDIVGLRLQTFSQNHKKKQKNTRKNLRGFVISAFKPVGMRTDGPTQVPIKQRAEMCRLHFPLIFLLFHRIKVVHPLDLFKILFKFIKKNAVNQLALRKCTISK